MKPVLLRLGILVAALMAMLLVGTVGFILLEGLPPSDAFYFTLFTLATVGHEDIQLSSLASKILSVVLRITSIGAFTAVVINITGLLLERRLEQKRRERMNLLIGIFFSEIGNHLLALFTTCDPAICDSSQETTGRQNWSSLGFLELGKQLRRHNYSIANKLMQLESLGEFLSGKSDLLFRLLENPSLPEQESFTELLRNVSHLREELSLRQNLTHLPEIDETHLIDDAERVYSLLAKMWLDHMHYLNKKYPYLFSLALRINPFNENRSPTVT